MEGIHRIADKKYFVDNCNLTEKSNCIEVLLHFAMPTGYTLEVRAVEHDGNTLGYGFSDYQKSLVDEMLAMDSSLWTGVLYGVYSADEAIVTVALSQVGNMPRRILNDIKL